MKAENELPLEVSNTPTVQTEEKKVNEVAEISDDSNWKLAQRKAMALSKSELLPKIYQNNIPNCLIAMELAQRTGMNELMVMQNLDIIHGRPSWRSTFCIAAINASKRFKGQLNYRVDGSGESLSCVAYAIGFDGEIFESPKITMAMAKAEGWLDKAGSKWKTIPELMIRYRAAAFFSRLFCPELLLGMQTDDEVNDIVGVSDHNDLEFLKSLYAEKLEFIPDAEKEHIQRIFDTKEETSYRKVHNLLKTF